MKKLFAAVSVCSIAALGLITSAAYANLDLSHSKTATIRFVPEEKGKEYFWCQVSDPSATVTVQTQNVMLKVFVLVVVVL